MSHPQHILAEVDSDRCTELRAELAAEQALCSYDELRVLRELQKRLAGGRQNYGYLDLARDRRNWAREGAEELLDAAIYRACAELTKGTP